MFKTLKIDTPLVVIDTETTGTDPKTARIIEICCRRFSPAVIPKGHEIARWILDPGVTIPKEASDVHGFTDEKVRGLRKFKAYAQDIMAFIGNSAVMAYNVRFDRGVLVREFLRAGLRWDLKRGWVDPQAIFFQHDKRDLTAAVKKYLGEDFADAHGAEADSGAACLVLDAQVKLYDDMPKVLTDLIVSQVDPEAMDIDGCFKLVNGVVTMGFGKHKGQPADSYHSYLKWMLGQDFLPDAQEIADAVLAGRQPKLF